MKRIRKTGPASGEPCEKHPVGACEAKKATQRVKRLDKAIFEVLSVASMIPVMRN
jgi:hypothetical protein